MIKYLKLELSSIFGMQGGGRSVSSGTAGRRGWNLTGRAWGVTHDQEEKEHLQSIDGEEDD